jgi:hypothetical protein
MAVHRFRWSLVVGRLCFRIIERAKAVGLGDHLVVEGSSVNLRMLALGSWRLLMIWSDRAK